MLDEVYIYVWAMQAKTRKSNLLGNQVQNLSGSAFNNKPFGNQLVLGIFKFA